MMQLTHYLRPSHPSEYTRLQVKTGQCLQGLWVAKEGTMPEQNGIAMLLAMCVRHHAFDRSTVSCLMTTDSFQAAAAAAISRRTLQCCWTVAQ